MTGSCRLAALGRSAAIVCLAGIWLAAAATALPASLRSEEDVADAVELVMSSVASGNVSAGVRSMGSYTSLSAEDLAERTVRINRDHRTRRKRLGLANDVEEIEKQRIGARLLRITQLQHFDKGYVVWRFTFHRPSQAWQLMELEVIENDRSIFGSVSARPEDAKPEPGEEPGGDPLPPPVTDAP